MTGNRRASFGIALAVLSVWLATLPRLALGQTVVASDILGQITDTAGSVVPDATVTVTNQNTGFTRTAKSYLSGTYLVNAIVSGVYTVSVEKAGFRKSLRTNLNLASS